MWRTPPGGRGQITLYPSDGSGTGIVIGPEIAGTAIWGWAPDSSRLLMNHNDVGEGGQVLIDPVTGTWSEPAWSANTIPDWQRLAP
jgi:hypothetical protein